MQYKKILSIIGVGAISASILSGCSPYSPQPDLYGPMVVESDWENENIDDAEDIETVELDNLEENVENVENVDLEVCLYGPAPINSDWNSTNFDTNDNDKDLGLEDAVIVALYGTDVKY